MKPNTTPDNFQLDEIQWERNNYPIHPDSMPLKDTMKGIIEKLENRLNQVNNKE